MSESRQPWEYVNKPGICKRCNKRFIKTGPGCAVCEKCNLFNKKHRNISSNKGVKNIKKIISKIRSLKK